MNMDTMHDFKIVLWHEFRRLLHSKKISTLLLALVLVLGSTQCGINQHDKNLEAGEKFKKSAEMTAKKIRNYDQYSYIGHELEYLAAPSCVFFSYPRSMTGLSGKINTVATLKISNNGKDKTVFIGKSAHRFRVSNVIKFLGVFLVVLYGFGLARNREYLTFLAQKIPESRVFLYVCLSRCILIGIVSLLIFGCSLGLALIEGSRFSPLEFVNLFKYLLVTLLMFIGFFFMGTLPGYIRSKELGLTMIFAIWIGFLNMMPGTIGAIVEKKAEKIPTSNQLYITILSKVNDFEERGEEAYGKFNENNMDSASRIVT
ncbi:MAG: hypothetical protein GY940_19265, partial [bacterium]|nr:hypothetical protein [bacterium]